MSSTRVALRFRANAVLLCDERSKRAARLLFQVCRQHTWLNGAEEEIQDLEEQRVVVVEEWIIVGVGCEREDEVEDIRVPECENKSTLHSRS